VVVIEGFAVNEIRTWSFKDPEPGDETVKEQFSQQPMNVYGFGHAPYLSHVAECIRHGTAALVDGLEGRKSLELITAIYESIETGKEIFLRFKSNKCRLGVRNG
jgi:predicted dehydrogenase